MAFIRQQRYDERIIATIERRAERGSNAVQTQVLLPIIILPLAATAGSLAAALPTGWTIIGWIVLFMLVLTLLREVERGNTDVIILSAIDEYHGEVEQEQRQLAMLLAAEPAPQQPSSIPTRRNSDQRPR